jgi:hypothetical protein
MVSYDSTGNVRWAKALPTGGDDNNSISIDRAGDIYIGGDIAIDSCIIVSDTLFKTGSESPFVAKLSFSSIGTVSGIEAVSTMVFPNPFTDNLFVNVKTPADYEIIIYDILSQKIVQKAFISSTSINTGLLAGGMYIYQLKTGDRIVSTGKIIRQ